MHSYRSSEPLVSKVLPIFVHPTSADEEHLRQKHDKHNGQSVGGVEVPIGSTLDYL